MSTNKLLPSLLAAFFLVSLACSIATPAPQANPNAFNTMVAQTALARPTIPPAVTAPPMLIPTTAIPPTTAPTITPTQGPAVLVSASINLPRHTALDFETQSVSGVLADMNLINKNRPDLSGYYKKAPPGSDLVFWAENPNFPEMQFLYPVNGTRVAALLAEALSKASYEDCVRAFRDGLVFPHPENDAFPLDYSVFVSQPGEYFCFTTDKGNLGAFKLTAPGNYLGMAYVVVDYILWDAQLP